VPVGIGDGDQVAGGVVGVGDFVAGRVGQFAEQSLAVMGEGQTAPEVVLDAAQRVGARSITEAERETVAVGAREAPAAGIVGLDGVVAVAVGPAGGGLFQLADDVGVADPLGGAAGSGSEVEDLAVVAQHEDEIGRCRGIEQHVVVVAPAVAQAAARGAADVIWALTVVIALEGQGRGAGKGVIGFPLDLAALAGNDRVGDAQVGFLLLRRQRTQRRSGQLDQATRAATASGGRDIGAEGEQQRPGENVFIGGPAGGIRVIGHGHPGDALRSRITTVDEQQVQLAVTGKDATLGERRAKGFLQSGLQIRRLIPTDFDLATANASITWPSAPQRSDIRNTGTGH
jgi:hypothetical protein